MKFTVRKLKYFVEERECLYEVTNKLSNKIVNMF